MKVDTLVLADLSGIGNASGHPVRWSMMVRMCLLPELEVSHSVTKSIVILSKGHTRISHLELISLNFHFFSVTKDTLGNVFPYIFVHSFPIVLLFY